MAHKREHEDHDKVLIEELVDASSEQIKAMVKKLMPKLLAELKTSTSKQDFLIVLSAALIPSGAA